MDPEYRFGPRGDDGRRGPAEVSEGLRSPADREIFGIFELGIVTLGGREINLISGRKNQDWESWEVNCLVRRLL